MKKSTCLKIIIPVLVLIIQFSTTEAQVGINQNNPNPSAILDLKSNNRGLLMPRLTIAQIKSIPKPLPAGLLVYCTDLSIFCYSADTANWISLPAWGQKLDLGDTTAVQNIIAKTNANSNVGIGTNSPTSKLTIEGNLAVGNNFIAPPNGAEITGQVKIGFSEPNPNAKEQLEVVGNINAEGNITATGNINTTDKIQENGYDLLPTGAIIMWSGTTIPKGWIICDGENGTPDLKGRFIVASGTRKTTTLNIDGTITEKDPKSFEIGMGDDTATDSVKLDITNLPTHNHGKTSGGAKAIFKLQVEGMGVDPNYEYELDQAANNPGSGFTDSDMIIQQSNHSHSIASQGGDIAHENRPPYYVLAFIMKE